MDISRGIRSEIQALRALAVVLVVACHYWPSRLPGGFIGVDVFFAISGYLITAHLLREVAATGTVRLAEFWARRARRILPAALVTLAACPAGTIAFVDLHQWPQFLREIRAGAAYVENWHLASTATDCFAADDGPSPAQHFWSLSTEEQFYIAWPVLIVVAAALPARRTIAPALALVTAGSLAFSVWYTPVDPAAAHFLTPVRAWEFGAGGVLALAPACAARPVVRAGLCCVGLAAILLAAITYGEATAFPGHAAALPVLGALVTMWAGTPMRIMRIAPVQVVGDLSYSVYLWHWPV